MVMTPPHMHLRREKLRLELGMLNLKKKIFGRLSEADEKRRRKIIAELNIKF